MGIGNKAAQCCFGKEIYRCHNLWPQVFCPAFYVVVDHSQKTVVVVIRGTFSIKVRTWQHLSTSELLTLILYIYCCQDALTDLSAQPSLLAISEAGHFYGHKVVFCNVHEIYTQYICVCVYAVCVVGDDSVCSCSTSQTGE